MNLLKLFSLILCFMSIQNVFSQNHFLNSENMVYHHPTPGEISIMAVSPIPSGQSPSYEAYKKVVDCGFNLVTTSSTIDYFQEQFNLLGNLDLKYIISNPHLLSDQRLTFIKSLKDNKHFGGWLLKDEPTFEYLPTLKEQYDLFIKEDNKNFILINLVGILEKNFTGNFTTLSDYINYINDLIKPQVWSFDYYPILIKDSKLTINYAQFYSTLEDFYSISKKTNRPFWAFCESMAYTTKWYSRPVATEEYLRFEAFSALAYGAQGIIYWTYGQRKSNEVETYTSALVNMNGKITKSWYAAQKVNQEIKKYNDVFYECKVEQVRHTGSNLYKGTKRLSGTIGPFKMIRSKDAGVIVSLIINKGETYVVLVSRDVLKKQTITLELSANKKVKNISSNKQEIYDWRKDVTLTLDKGGYVIFKVVE